MRKIMWFTIGFALASAFCVFFLWNRDFLPYLSAALFGCLLCMGLGFRKKVFRIPGQILLGASLGIGWFFLFYTFYIQPITRLDGETIPLSVTASDYSKPSRYGMSVDGTAVIDGKPYKLTVYLKEDTALSPGDILESEFRIRLTTPEGRKESAYYQGNGLYLLATQKGGTEVVHPQSVPVWCLPAVIARTAEEHLEACFPEDTVAFAKALLLGDTSELTYEEDTALKISGIRHVAAVSGLHVSFLFGLVYWLCGKRKGLTLLVSLPVLLLFAAITGFTPSVTRACLMTGLMALGGALKEEYDGLTGLSFASLVMLLLNPYAVNSVSFQLSVSSVAGILLFASPIYGWFCGLFGNSGGIAGRMIRWAGGSVSVSVSAALITTPISAYYFGTISLVSVLTNLVTIWIIGLAFAGIGFVCLFGGVAAGVCGFAAEIISWMLRCVMAVAGFLSKIPFAAVYTQSEYIVIWLVICYLLAILFFLLGRKHLPVILTAAAGTLVIAIGLSVGIPRLDGMRLTVMDVGEGQSILLQSGGQYFLIDCGGDTDTRAANTAAQTLLSQGIFHLDGIVLTHYDYDHAGGAGYLLSRVPAEHIYLPDMEDKGFAESLPEELLDKLVFISRDTSLSLEDGVLTLTEPGTLKTANENCMCVLFESEKCVILITGDRSRSGEKRLIASRELPHVDVLIAGHHGAKSGTSYELLQAVTPEIVIISVGANNSYGHPAEEVLDRLAEFECIVYRTDLEGSVLIRR